MYPLPGSIAVDLQSGTQIPAQGVFYAGLPVVGVSLVRYMNGALSVGGMPTLSNYGAGAAAKATPAVVVP